MTTRKLAEDITNLFKYNADLSHAEKIMAVELRLKDFEQSIERACAEAHKRAENNKVVIDSRPQDIPILAELLINNQKSRGLTN
jgi:hypothetical protein